MEGPFNIKIKANEMKKFILNSFNSIKDTNSYLSPQKIKIKKNLNDHKITL